MADFIKLTEDMIATLRVVAAHFNIEVRQNMPITELCAKIREAAGPK